MRGRETDRGVRRSKLGGDAEHALVALCPAGSRVVELQPVQPGAAAAVESGAVVHTGDDELGEKGQQVALEPGHMHNDPAIIAVPLKSQGKETGAYRPEFGEGFQGQSSDPEDQ